MVIIGLYPATNRGIVEGLFRFIQLQKAEIKYMFKAKILNFCLILFENIKLFYILQVFDGLFFRRIE